MSNASPKGVSSWILCGVLCLAAVSVGKGAGNDPVVAPVNVGPKGLTAAGAASRQTSVNHTLDVRSSAIQSLDFAQESESELTTTVIVDGRTWTLDLQKHSVRSPDFEVWVQDASGELTLVEPPPIRTYKGSVRELPGSDVRASFSDGELEAVVHTPEGIFGIHPLSKIAVVANPGEHAVYRNVDWMNRRGYSCATDGVDHQLEEFDGLDAPMDDHRSVAGTGLSVAEIAIDADYEFYVLNGSNVDATIQDMENVINGIAAIYEAQLNITYEITSAVVRAVEPDPYTATNQSTLLSQLVSHWNTAPQSSIRRDTVHLFTGKDLDGSVIGVAYVGAVCNLNWAYGLSQSRFTTSMTSRVALVAHEIGHNWNAQHCNNCTACTNCCQIMCSGIGGCSGILNSFGCQELDQMSAFRDTRTCLSAPAGCTTIADCDDGLYCNGAESCVSGSCQAGSAPNCSDGVACTVDTCNEATNQCGHALSNALCSDGLYCNGPETCAATGCLAGSPPNCNDGIACTADSCNEATDQCIHAPNNSLCGDGLYCNGTEVCTATGCAAGSPPNCNDGVACTADSCNETTNQCNHAINNALCNDGLFCNGTETCSATGCVAGAPPCGGSTCDEGLNACDSGGSVSIWLVFTDSATVPVVGTVQNEDIVAYDLVNGTWSLVLDGSDVGLTNMAMDAMAVLPSGDVLLSFASIAFVQGLTGGPNGILVDDSDIVRFVPTSLGANTAGTFAFYFDGSDVGLTTDAEDVDAISFTADGRLVLSTLGNFLTAADIGDDTDLLVFTGTSLGSVTAGTFMFYLDGSDVGLSTAQSEDVDGVSLTADGTILLSTLGPFSVPGVSGLDEDVVEFFPTALGQTTIGTYSMYLDLSALGISTAENIAALEFVE